jgi:hypothetical protein
MKTVYVSLLSLGFIFLMKPAFAVSTGVYDSKRIQLILNTEVFKNALESQERLLSVVQKKAAGAKSSVYEVTTAHEGKRFVQTFTLTVKQSGWEPTYDITHSDKVEDKTIILNLETCEKKPARRIDLSQGSTQFEVLGIEGDACAFQYSSSGELEAPGTTAQTPTVCKVPSSLGEIKVRVKDSKHDFSGLKTFCK